MNGLTKNITRYHTWTNKKLKRKERKIGTKHATIEKILKIRTFRRGLIKQSIIELGT